MPLACPMYDQTITILTSLSLFAWPSGTNIQIYLVTKFLIKRKKFWHSHNVLKLNVSNLNHNLILSEIFSLNHVVHHIYVLRSGVWFNVV